MSADEKNSEITQAKYVEIARQSAVACHERHDYMPGTARQAETWQPHRWAIDAMLCAADVSRRERDALLEMNAKQAQTIASLREAMKTIEPYIRDKTVWGRKPMKEGIYTLHLGKIVSDALDA